MIGTLLNVAAISAGSALGLLFGGRIPERARTTVLGAMGAATLTFGVSMGLETANLHRKLRGYPNRGIFI